jgi:hypothetical protein
MNTVVVAAAQKLTTPIEVFERMPEWLKIGLATGLAAVAFVVVRLGGGSPSPLNHLGYAPILVAAYLYGGRGGIVGGIGIAFLLGRLPIMLGLPGTESFESTVIRSLSFVGVGTITGLLFDRARQAKHGLRGATVTITSREHEAMIALARGAEAKDIDTGAHVGRVQTLSQILATRTGMDELRASEVGWSAMLHDVGKLHVPDKILLKPGPLTAAEWEIMRQHTIWGAEILAHGDGFEIARVIARSHHENWDGSGYPDGKRTGGIPLEARIVRIADSFDAITNRRAYKDAQTDEWALEELDRFAGKHFDPHLVRLFIDAMRASNGLPAIKALLAAA